MPVSLWQSLVLLLQIVLQQQARTLPHLAGTKSETPQPLQTRADQSMEVHSCRDIWQQYLDWQGVAL